MNIGQAILSTVLFMLVVTIIGLWLVIPPLIDFLLLIPYYSLITNLLIFIVILLFVKRYRVKERPLLAPTPPYWYLIAICVGVIFVFAQSPLRVVFEALIGTHPEVVTPTSIKDIPKYFFYIQFIAVSFIVPINEELFFREFQQQHLHQKYEPVLVIVVNALLFGLMHLPLYQWIVGQSNDLGRQAFMAFFGGLGQGFIYYKSKSVGPSIAMHMAWNVTVGLY